jgi:acetyl esterase
MWADTFDSGTAFGGLPGERFGTRPARGHHPLVLLLHGGSFVAGTADDVRPLARRIADLGAVVQTLSYPLAPAHPFPAAFDSLSQALAQVGHERQHLAGRGAPLYVAGIEAGGNLAAALALRARDEGQPSLAGQILIAPMLDPRLGSAAMREARHGGADCVYARGWRQYLAECRHAEHPYAVPLAATRLAGVAPALLVAVEGDALRDDATRYAVQLRGAGVPTTELMLPARADPGQPWTRLLGDQLRVFFDTTATTPVAA